LRAAIDCVVVADASGRIVEFNPAAERTFGYSRKEALGRTMAELIVPPSLRERHIAAFARFVKTREGSMLGRRVELTGMRADGSEFPVELALSLVEAEPVLICGALRDISTTKQSENHLRELADEQATLRQVATLVAYESSPERLVAVVVEQVARVFDVPLVRLIRYEPAAAVVVGGFNESEDEPFPTGSRWQLDTPGLLATIRDTGRAARVEDYAQAPGDAAGAVRAAGMRSAVGSPIVVGGDVWGAIVLLSPRSASLPEDTGVRLADFTDLVATALANAESRTALSQLADEQAALRRVATMVARAPASEQLFSTVAREVAGVLDVPGVIVTRYDPDGMALTLGEAFHPDLAGAEQFLGVGTQMPRDPGSLAAQVFDTHGPARVDDFSRLPGTVGELARAARLGSGCAGPIVVNGAVWGKMCVFSRVGAALPAGTENRLQDFIELVATAIANYEARADLAASEARARELADEQAALRRVATLVAEGAAPTEVFDAVIAEVGQLLGAAQVGLARYENEHEISVLAIRGQNPEVLRAGVRLPLDGDSVNARILRTGRSARLDFAEDGNGSIAEILRRDNVNATVGAPILVDGAVWGMVAASWRGHDQPPADAEERLAQFAELLDTAIANADSRDQLMASRARVIAAADESRRRIERDLHDGAQQRLITLTVALRRAEAKLAAGSDEVRADLNRVAEGLTTAVDELRELSRGIHPSILSEGGLAPALKALGRRSPIRVKLDMPFEQRLPDELEVAAYYTVSEALTNASKHADCTRVWVSLRVDDGVFLLRIRDDGVGGAHASRGSGLTGLRDRIEALGGTFGIESPTGSGTVIEVNIPIVGPTGRAVEPAGLLLSRAAIGHREVN
jgi:PAS domain S-box-containing protein